MTLWRKVGTLFRASAHEPLEQLVDANALRIMEQELRDTENAMLLAKRELAGLMATIKQLQRSNQQLSDELQQREEQARQALERDVARVRQSFEDLSEQEATTPQIAECQQQGNNSRSEGLHELNPNMLWRQPIVVPENSPFEAAAYLESLHEGRALFRGEWNLCWARLRF